MFDDLFSGNTLFFSIPAIAGTIFFLVRLIMMFAGLSVDHGGMDLESHAGDLAGGDAHHSTELFKILSIQSIGAFLMGFGWGGLGGLRGAGWDFTAALLSAVGGGIAMVWLLTWLLKVVHDLQSTGAVSIQSAIGAEGDVYVTVPAHGQGAGQVRVIVEERQRIYNAVSETDALPSNTRVRVCRVNEDNTLTVAPL
jgi:membrane protein implicated in regulation of membrane protease activity